MKLFILTAAIVAWAAGAACGQKPVVFDKPDLTRGASLMSALQNRHSERKFAQREVTDRDLGDLLWAANGVNRPETGKRTAPSAMNRQDVKLYVIRRDGVYVYDPQGHALTPISTDDHRASFVYPAPVGVLLVADEDTPYAGIDAGYVSQNIYLFCAANGLATVACGTMDEEAFRGACRLDDKQKIEVWHPVGYPEE